MNGISVIIPVYNRQEFISQAIRSVLNQNYNGTLEIIISDDGSTDRTLEIVNSYADKVKLVRKPAGQSGSGASGARNRGLMAAEQPLVCFLDSDDFYLPDHLNRASAALEKHPDTGFVFCSSLLFKESTGMKMFKRWTHNPVLRIDVTHPVVSRSLIVTTNAFLFRREVFSRVGYFNEIYSNAEDSDMWMRISEQYKGLFLDYYGAAYRIDHGYGQLSKIHRDTISLSSLNVFKDAIDRYYSRNLKNQFRIFTLKRYFYYYKYEKRMYIYRLISLFLVCRYPLGFLQRIPLVYYGYISRRRNHGWQSLDFFIDKTKSSEFDKVDNDLNTD